MNKFESFDKELVEFQESIPFLGIPGGGLNLRKIVISLRFRLGFGTGTNTLRHDKEAITNAIPMIVARIQEVNSDIEHAWFFQKKSFRVKRDILVKIHQHMIYALDLIAKS